MKKVFGALVALVLVTGFARPAAALPYPALINGAVVLEARGPLRINLGTVSARLGELTDVRAPLSGPPLPGRSITFRSGTTTLCTATTGADGWARCPLSAAQTVTVLLGGFTSSFAGDEGHEPATNGSVLIALPGFAI